MTLAIRASFQFVQCNSFIMKAEQVAFRNLILEVKSNWDNTSKKYSVVRDNLLLGREEADRQYKEISKEMDNSQKLFVSLCSLYYKNYQANYDTPIALKI